MALYAGDKIYTEIMKEHLVSYETAIKFKELEFDDHCNYAYNYPAIKTATTNYPILTDSVKGVNAEFASYVTAPRLDQAQKWLRDKHSVDVHVRPFFRNIVEYTKFYVYTVTEWKDREDFSSFKEQQNGDFCTYEQALEAGINKALELL